MQDNGQGSQSNAVAILCLLDHSLEAFERLKQLKTRHANSITKTLQNKGSNNKHTTSACSDSFEK